MQLNRGGRHAAAEPPEPPSAGVRGLIHLPLEDPYQMPERLAVKASMSWLHYPPGSARYTTTRWPSSGSPVKKWHKSTASLGRIDSLRGSASDLADHRDDLAQHRRVVARDGIEGRSCAASTT